MLKYNYFSRFLLFNRQLIRMESVQKHFTEEIIKEGKTQIITKYTTVNKPTLNSSMEEPQKIQDVFYNPVQVFNRDLSLLVVRQFGKDLQKKKTNFKGMKILDALTASGLRALRMKIELPNDIVDTIEGCDISPNAINLFHENIKLNNLLPDSISIFYADAIDHMYKKRKSILNEIIREPYNVIDLDPYGTAVPFLNAALEAISDEGLLCVTCTDLKILSGKENHKTFYNYGTTKANVDCHAENSLRIVLQTINTTANRLGKYITPLISYQSEFYLRVFVRVDYGLKECSKSMEKTGTILYCENCNNFHVHRHGELKKKSNQYKTSSIDYPSNCDICGDALKPNGPIWLYPLNDCDFVKNILDYMEGKDFDMELATFKRINGMLHGILDEKPVENFPFIVNPTRISSFLHCSVLGQKKFISAMNSLGHTVIPSYISQNEYRISCSPSIAYHTVKAWKLKTVPKEKLFANLEEKSGAYKFLSLPTLDNFEPNFDKISDMAKYFEKRPSIFFPNPEKHWGPKARANLSQEKAVKKINANEEEKSKSIEIESKQH